MKSCSASLTRRSTLSLISLFSMEKHSAVLIRCVFYAVKQLDGSDSSWITFATGRIHT